MMSAAYLVWGPLGDGHDGRPCSLYLSPRGSRDVPTVATRGTEDQADLAYLLPLLPLRVVAKWTAVMETALGSERIFIQSKDQHHTRIRQCALRALDMLRTRLAMEAA